MVERVDLQQLATKNVQRETRPIGQVVVQSMVFKRRKEKVGVTRNGAVMLPVHVLEGDRSADVPGFELELPRGLRLHVPSAFDETSLVRLLRVVETSA